MGLFFVFSHRLSIPSRNLKVADVTHPCPEDNRRRPGQINHAGRLQTAETAINHQVHLVLQIVANIVGISQRIVVPGMIAVALIKGSFSACSNA